MVYFAALRSIDIGEELEVDAASAWDKQLSLLKRGLENQDGSVPQVGVNTFFQV